MARVTRPGGVVAACVWDYPGEMTLLRAFWDAAREVDPARAAAADEGVVMRWCADGELAELWRAVAAVHDAYRRRLGVGDGAFQLTARAWAAAGTVPGWS
jgi:hypothetical protein